jgi:hypothetical protein
MRTAATTAGIEHPQRLAVVLGQWTMIGDANPAGQ